MSPFTIALTSKGKSMSPELTAWVFGLGICLLGVGAAFTDQSRKRPSVQRVGLLPHQLVQQIVFGGTVVCIVVLVLNSIGTGPHVRDITSNFLLASFVIYLFTKGILMRVR